MDLRNTIKNKRELIASPSDLFRNEDGAIDLSSIMVGIIVIGLIGGVIAATVFAVIPWSQDNAAKQQLDSLVQAENAYFGLSSANPSPLPAGYTVNSFADSTGLANANLLQIGTTYCAVTSNGGKNYQGYSASGSGSVWSVTDSNSKPVSFTGTLPASCQFILTSASSSASPSTPPSNDLTWSKKTTTNPGPIVGTSGNFAAQLANVGSSNAYVSTNSGVLWTSVPGTMNANSGSSSENGQYMLLGRNLTTGATGPINFSTDGGNTWSVVGNGYIEKTWVSNDGKKILLAGGGGGGNVNILSSTDGGSTFTAIKTLPSAYAQWKGLAVSNDGSKIYAVDNSNQLYISSDSGATWSQKSMSGVSGVSTDSIGKAILISDGATGKVSISTNYGSTFTQVAVGTSTTQSRTVSQQAVSSDGQTMTVTGVEGAGTQVFISRDGGLTWTAQSTLPNSAWVSEVSSDGAHFLTSSGTTVYQG